MHSRFTYCVAVRKTQSPWGAQNEKIAGENAWGRDAVLSEHVHDAHRQRHIDGACARHPRGLPRLARIVAFLVGSRISGIVARIAVCQKIGAPGSGGVGQTSSCGFFPNIGSSYSQFFNSRPYGTLNFGMILTW